MFSNLADWVTEVIDQLGYLGVAFLVALENVFPPIPSEVVLPFAGFVASDGGATLIGMIIAATIGSLVGALVLYGFAAWIGPERLDRFLLTYGKWFRLTSADVRKSEAWFDRHSNSAVLICRCIPLVRSLISIPAGFRRMPLGRFVLYTTLGVAGLERRADRRRLRAAFAVGRGRADPQVGAVRRDPRDPRRHRLVRLGPVRLPRRPRPQRHRLNETRGQTPRLIAVRPLRGHAIRRRGSHRGRRGRAAPRPR